MKTFRAKTKRWGFRVLLFVTSMIPIPFLSTHALAATGCPLGKVECPFPGACRRFLDADGGGFCDLAQLDPGLVTTPTTEAVVATTDPATVTADLTPTTDMVVANVDPSNTTSSVVSPVLDGQVANIDSAGFSLATHYFVSPIAIGFLLVYALSFFLYKTNRMRVTTHRKIWNVLLLVTFLITGIFGLLLTVQLDYELPFQIPIDLLFWHVEAGLVMTFISIFHIAWHAKYYARMLRTSRSKTRAADSARRHPAQRGSARGQVPPIPERTYAFESRRG